jgi:hypothetical protein
MQVFEVGHIELVGLPNKSATATWTRYGKWRHPNFYLLSITTPIDNNSTRNEKRKVYCSNFWNFCPSNWLWSYYLNSW